MDNKTKNARKQKPAPLPKPQAILKFPFHAVDDLTMVFGASIPGYQDVIRACPSEFRDDYNQWVKLAHSVFFQGADIRGWKFNDPALREQQLRYLRTWLGSFEPKHEVKGHVCGWLLSLMLMEYPS